MLVPWRVGVPSVHWIVGCVFVALEEVFMLDVVCDPWTQ